MQKFQKGNKKAFEELYKRYSNRIYAYFMRLFNNNQQRAQDFTQDAFIKVIDKKLSFDTKHKFQPWLFTIATYMARTSFRDEKLTEDVSDHENKNPYEPVRARPRPKQHQELGAQQLTHIKLCAEISIHSKNLPRFKR